MTRRRTVVLIASIVSCVVLVAVAVGVWAEKAMSKTPNKTVSGSVVVAPHKVPSAVLTGSLALPLTGEVQAGLLRAFGPIEYTGPPQATKGGVAGDAIRSEPASAGPESPGSVGTQSVDVPPGTGKSLDRLFTHVSPDGVRISTFLSSRSGAQTNTRDAYGSDLVRGGSTRPAPGGIDSCEPPGELTLELSNTRAVATYTEPYFGEFPDPLIDVQIGEIGVTEGSPASWIEAQVGSAAENVSVRFADGANDTMSPRHGVVVLATNTVATRALGGEGAMLEVLGHGGSVLADYRIQVGDTSQVPTAGLPPVSLPRQGASHTAEPVAARDQIEAALTASLSCSEPPVEQARWVAGGGPYEEIGGAGSVGIEPGDRVAVQSVVFTSSSRAVVQYQVTSTEDPQPATLVAAASDTAGRWRISLGSVAPGLQVATADQDGNVSVAPGGPLFVSSDPGGLSIAVYRSVRSNPADNGCAAESCTGSPTPQCVPTGGTVEEITTPGAVGIASGPLFANYRTPIIGAALGIVGEAEGSPATLITSEVSGAVSKVELTTRTGIQTIIPTDGIVDTVLPGPPASSIGDAGATLVALGGSGQSLASVPFKADASEPAPASSLPPSLPPPSSGSPPPDPLEATSEIVDSFETVFGCASSPFVRSGDIQDNGMFTNPLEQLYLGPYTSLVESVYATVGNVVFVNPGLADVSYTIRFHNDPNLAFSQIGSAVVVDGTWRVSYATLCAAVGLGGVSCSS